MTVRNRTEVTQSNPTSFVKVAAKVLIGATLLGSAAARASRDLLGATKQAALPQVGSAHEYAALLHKPMSASTQRALLSVEAEPVPAFPLSVTNNRLTYANNQTARFIGANVGDNTDCGVAPRTTEETCGLMRALAGEGFNMFVMDTIWDESMAANTTKLAPYIDIANFVRLKLPTCQLFFRPLTDGILTGRGGPYQKFNTINEFLASALKSNPNVGLAVGKETHPSGSDKVNEVGNAEFNSNLQADFTTAINGIRAVNPDMIVLQPAGLGANGARYSRDVSQTNNTAHNVMISADPYTTEATEDGQWKEYSAWVGNHKDKNIFVTELAAGADTDLGNNMTLGVSKRIAQDLYTARVPFAFWFAGYDCNPGMLASPFNAADGLNLTTWGTQVVDMVQNLRLNQPL